MKFNWGHGIAIGLALFIGYILFLVIQAMNTNFDLETEDYYAKELKFQQTIDLTENYNSLNREILADVKDGKIHLDFPTSSIDSGLVKLLRPSNKDLDQNFTIANNQGSQVILNTDNKPAGRYILEIEWSSEGVAYFAKINAVL